MWRLIVPSRWANQIWYQLTSFDPTLIRAVTAPPLQRIKAAQLLSFVVVGRGAAPLFTLKVSPARGGCPREIAVSSSTG